MQATGQPAGPFAALSESKRQLLASLRAERSQHGSANTVDRLRPGAGSPIVLIHPVGGNILSYVNLVRAIPEGRPVVALAADGRLADHTPPAMDELAAYYRERLERAGVTPAVLVGWSFGGVLAYEMGRQHAQHAPPLHLVLIDSLPTPDGYPSGSRPESEIVQSFMYNLVRSAGQDPTSLGLTQDMPLWQQPPATALSVAVSHLTNRGMTVGMTVADLMKRYDVYRNAVRALDGYHLPTYPHPVHLVQGLDAEADILSVWAPVAADLRVTPMMTDHYGLLAAPYVDEVGQLIGRLAQAGDG